MCFSITFSSSSVVGVSADVVISLALKIFSDAVAGVDVDADEAVLLSRVSMLILIFDTPDIKINTSKLNNLEPNLVSNQKLSSVSDI